MPSSSSTTTRFPAGFDSSSTSQTVSTFSWSTPGSRSTSGFTLEKPDRDGDRPGRDDHAVRLQLAHELDRSFRLEPDVDSVPQELTLEVPRDPAELVAAGRAQDQVDLASESVVALGERDVVATLREDGGRLHPGRSAAGNQPARRRLRAGQRARTEPSLAPGPRIHRARDRQALEDATDAALVAPDAMDDLVLPPLLDLVRELGIGDLGAGHRHHVGLAGGEDLLRERRVLDPADGEHGQADDGLDLGGQVDEVPVRHVRRLDRLEDVVVARGGDVHVVDLALRLEGLRDPDRVVDVERARDEIRQADAHADDPVRSRAAPHLVDHLAGEPQPVVEGAAVLVLALVVERREELVEEVAVRDVHLRPVEAAFARQLRRPAPPVDDLADVLVLHRLRRLAVRRRLDRGRPPEDTEVVRRVARRVEPEVVQLREDHRAVLVDGVRQPSVRFERAGSVGPGDARETGGRGRVDDPVAGDQQPRPSLGARRLVGDVPVGVDRVVRPELHVSGLHDPVPHRHAADLQRAEQMWVGAHRDSFQARTVSSAR